MHDMKMTSRKILPRLGMKKQDVKKASEKY